MEMAVSRMHNMVALRQRVRGSVSFFLRSAIREAGATGAGLALVGWLEDCAAAGGAGG